MPIPIEYARSLIAELQTSQVTNLFAQAHARHVLHEVGEAQENFPAFDPNLDDKVTFPAYALLAAGCSMVEQGYRADGVAPLERAASLLQYVHGPNAKNSRESGFHVFLAAMAFYAAGHYSRAFLAVRVVENQTPAARMIAAFLRKDVIALIERLNEVLLRDPLTTDDQVDLDEWGIAVAIARAVAIALEFIFAGESDSLVIADDHLQDAALITSTGNHPAWWWIVRLLRLMLKDLGDASPWSILPPYFDPGSGDVLGRYIRLLAFTRRPIAELWSSQRAALPLALNHENRGGVINLRTSAGKTRVAELAILQTLLADPMARVFYLAPFRSLALEIEQTLAATFAWLGYGVSHLYGGSRVSSVDTELASGSNIIIATPEKARALFRTQPELFENVRLFVVDEGHLIGPSERFVRNEVFIDHLRSLAQAKGARMLLLSAVLPNANELAEWISDNPAEAVSSTWKPSAERFGLLRWNGRRVRVDWQGEIASFNPSFVEAKRLGFGRRKTLFPKDKYEAVAATAIRLSAIGPVMIFTGRAVSVPTLAKAVLVGLGERPEDHVWPEDEWKAFEAICEEDLDPDAIELRAARAGVVCHSNQLTPRVRLALEHLMRSKPPKIIIATTTLAQGVNVGIASVIVATPYIGQKTIDKRDFWNICGRAGRAFVDGEGKILYAIDDTNKRWQIQKDEELARSYFEAGITDRVESGLLFIVRVLRQIASRADVSFDLLLELAANNDFSRMGDNARTCESICDLVDDELLALHTDAVVNPAAEEPILWVERLFRHSLAAIQARSGVSDTGAEDVLGFLRARAESVLRRTSQSMRKAIVSSGLPLSVAFRAQERLDFFSRLAASYNSAQESLSAVVAVVREIEDWARVHATEVTGQIPAADKLDPIREGWLAGVGLRVLTGREPDAKEITRELYGYQLPWILHAASQQLCEAEELEGAAALGKISLLLELGVPSELAARIFLAGVRSRAASTELATLPVDFGSTLAEISRNLRNTEFTEEVRPLLSALTLRWLDLLAAEAARYRREPLPDFAAFTLAGGENLDLLYPRRLGDQIFLTSVDGQTRFSVEATHELPFDKVANDPRVAFIRSGDTWHLVIRDPRLQR